MAALPRALLLAALLASAAHGKKVKTPEPTSPPPSTPPPSSSHPSGAPSWLFSTSELDTPTRRPVTPFPFLPLPPLPTPPPATPLPTEAPSTAPPTLEPIEPTPVPTEEPTTASPTLEPTTASPTRLGNCDDPDKTEMACRVSLYCRWIVTGVSDNASEGECVYATPPPTISPSMQPTPQPTPQPTTLQPTTMQPTWEPTAKMTMWPTDEPTASVAPTSSRAPTWLFSTSQVDAPTDHPILALLQPGEENCYDPALSKQACKDALNCEWTKDDITGEMGCEFLPYSTSQFTPTTSTPPAVVENCFVFSLDKDTCLAASNCEWLVQPNGDTICRDVSAAPVENCYVLSLNEADCLMASNCEWLLDSNGNTFCKDLPIVADNCYVLSLSENECKVATNCEWVVGSTGMTLCRDIPGSTPSMADTPFPTYLSLPIGDPTNPIVGMVADCDDPALTKQECKDSINCVWDRNANECIEVTMSPTDGPTEEPDPTRFPTRMPSLEPTDKPTSEEPTRMPTEDPTYEPTPAPTPQPTDEPTPSPTEEPTVKPNPAVAIDENTAWASLCDDPGITKNDCKDLDECEWDKQEDLCLTITAEPTRSPVKPTPPPTPKPTKEPTTPLPTAPPSPSPTPGPSKKPTPSPTISMAPTAAPSDSPTKSSAPTISSKPTPSPTITAFPTKGGYQYVRPQRNDVRFVPWNKLDRASQKAAEDHLRYTKETWDVLGSNPIEQLRWADLSDAQRNAAMELGFADEVSWNCWQNHWESFSWKQLHSLELTPYLEALGWDMDSWNNQYSDPPMNRRQLWAELDEEQKQHAQKLCYYKSSYDRLDIAEYGMGYPIAKPPKRFVPWEDIDDTLRVQLEQSLGYTELTWNVIGLAEVEQKGWFEFMYYEKDTATALGYDDASWDCWQNHYDSYGWSDLVKKGHDVHMAGLGWSELSWNEEIDPPASNGKTWVELNETEQLHATELCYNEDIWDQVDMTRNPGPFPFPKPPRRYVVWDQLDEEEMRIATNVFLYEESTWNDVGTADIEKRSWDDLTEYQRPYAVQLGLYHRTWDCFQNHYRATRWDDLPEEVKSAAIALGWDSGSWSSWSGAPALYQKKWSQLEVDEQSAAHALCHFHVTWPGDGEAINLINQYEGDASDASRLAVRILFSAVLAIAASVLFV